MVYILQSKLITTEKILREGQKTISNNELESILKAKGASKETIVAWQCAIKVKYVAAFSLAMTAAPSLEMLAKLLLREYAVIEKFPTPPPAIQLQIPQQMIPSGIPPPAQSSEEQQNQPKIEQQKPSETKD